MKHSLKKNFMQILNLMRAISLKHRLKRIISLKYRLMRTIIPKHLNRNPKPVFLCRRPRLKKDQMTWKHLMLTKTVFLTRKQRQGQKTSRKPSLLKSLRKRVSRTVRILRLRTQAPRMVLSVGRRIESGGSGELFTA